MELPNARPYAFKFNPATTALIIIDMQRDFLLPNGFGAIQCGSPEIFSYVSSIVPAVQRALHTCRSLGFHVVHTREGHKPDLSDLPAAKKLRQISAPGGHHSMGIGEQGPMGRLLVRGEWGHDIIDELAPIPGEVVIDKPGKGSFWGTGIHRALLARGITHLLFAGVTTECCVTTTVRECSDRGFECCILSDCTGGFDSNFVNTSMDMICSYDGLFGYVGHGEDLHALNDKQHQLTPPSTPTVWDGDISSISEIKRLYQSGQLEPEMVIDSVFDRITKYRKIDPAVWIDVQDKDDILKQVLALKSKFAGRPSPELFGIPFAVKDNIDIKGVRTTAGCEAYAYTADKNAPVVQQLLDAGALYIGKLNMDQLATGLSGCRSPYGTPRSFHSQEHISGGSSSGSGVAVAAGLVSFTLGTDTAGSGRVPAALNGIVGYKPTKGTLSARGVVPACKSLDTISIFTKTISDARKVWYVAEKYDSLDPFAKLPSTLATWKTDFRGPKHGGFTFAIPPSEALSICTSPYLDQFHRTIATLTALGGTRVSIDWTPFTAASDLLYNGSLIHERLSCIGIDFLTQNTTDNPASTILHPTTRSLFHAAITKQTPAWQLFHDQALQAQYTRQAQQDFQTIDVLVCPTVSSHPTVAEMEADPLGLNAKMGEFTHFANVLDLCAVSVNGGWIDGGNGLSLPFGVSFVGASGLDGRVLDVAALFEGEGRKC